MFDFDSIISGLITTALTALLGRGFNWWNTKRQQKLSQQDLTQAEFVSRLRADQSYLLAYCATIMIGLFIVGLVGVILAIVAFSLPTEINGYLVRTWFIGFAIGTIVAAIWSGYDQIKLLKMVVSKDVELPNKVASTKSLPQPIVSTIQPLVQTRKSRR